MQTSLSAKEPLRSLMLNAIKSIKLYNRTPINWINQDVRLLIFHTKTGIVTHEEVEGALHEALTRQGRACFGDHLFSSTYPDHTASPAAFAYALKNQVFTPEEEGAISYDHGENKQEFIKSYENGLREYLLKRLFTEQPENIWQPSFEYTSCGDGGPCTC